MFVSYAEAQHVLEFLECKDSKKNENQLLFVEKK